MKNTNPPDVVYPEDHSPFCSRDCDHPCHDPYDEWVASNKKEGENE